MPLTFTSPRPGQHILELKAPAINGDGVIAPDVRKDYTLVDHYEHPKPNAVQLCIERFCILFAIHGADLFEKPFFVLLFVLAVVLPFYFVFFHFYGFLSFIYRYTTVVFPIIVFSGLYWKLNQKPTKNAKAQKAKTA